MKLLTRTKAHELALRRKELAQDAPADDGPDWQATLAVEGEPTEDGRLLEVGSITWRDPPLTLMAMIETTEGGHIGAQVAGRMDVIWRDGADILATGDFDTNEYGQMIAGLVEDRTLRGVSVDLAILAYEIRDAETGEVLDGDQQIEYWLDDKPTLFVVTDGVIGMATVCPFQAIEDAGIESITAGAGGLHMRWFTPFPKDDLTALAAGAAPALPPAEWFDEPDAELLDLGGWTVTDEGRVFGWVAQWDTCHTADPQGLGVCTLAPRSPSGYSMFHLGQVVTEEGDRVNVGTLTLDTDHAAIGLDPRAVTKHYDHTGVAAADVRVGENERGIWIAGAVRPNLSMDDLRALRAAKVSGDWRRVNGGPLELLATLGVNVPGFPVPRAEALVASSGDVEAIVAAGMVLCDDDELSVEDADRRLRVLTARANGGLDGLIASARG